MADYAKLEANIESIIDSLKGILSQQGLGNSGDEGRVITTIFLYKFLNDKFIYNLKQFAEEINIDYKTILKNENDELDAFYDKYSGNIALNYEDTIEALMEKASRDDFYKEFDNALKRISANPKNENFNIETADGTKKLLFEAVTTNVEDSTKNNFAQALFSTISTQRLDFSQAFEDNFDFYSRIFEYLIKDYNVASGTYAEYFTPQAVSKIIARILVGMSDTIKACEIYDPSAGSGSLVLHLANELGKEKDISRAIVYTQDISQKSSRFLRINLLLNGLTDSLHNAIQGDTLLRPSHYEVENDPQSPLKTFDYIVANPPFKLDFSSTRDSIESKWASIENKDGLKRFFAGVPKIPNKDKKKMPIYLLFIQHILFSLKSKGKAAIVVPTGFITAKSGIEFAIRDYIVKNKMLKGCISMPSNIFANTGTNVSVLFIDKDNKTNHALLMDASSFGKKVKEGSNQKTVLSHEEEELIIDTFINRRELDDVSKLVSFDEISEKNNSFSVGQYFEIKMEYVDITEEEFLKQMADFESELTSLFEESKKLDEKIINDLKNLKFNKNKD